MSEETKSRSDSALAQAPVGALFDDVSKPVTDVVGDTGSLADDTEMLMGDSQDGPVRAMDLMSKSYRGASSKQKSGWTARLLILGVSLAVVAVAFAGISRLVSSHGSTQNNQQQSIAPAGLPVQNDAVTINGQLQVKQMTRLETDLNVGGNGAFTGDVTAANFHTSSLQVSGDGNFTGTLKVGSITSSIIQINGNGNFTGNITVNGVIQGSGFKANGLAGMQLTCSAGQIIKGASVSGGIVTGATCGSQDVTVLPATIAYTDQDNTFTGSNSFTGLLSGNGAGLTGVDALTLQGNSSAYFTDASNLSTGTLSDSRLSTNVAQLSGLNDFTGTLQHNGNDVCDDSGNCGAYAASSGSGSYIQNSTSIQSAANFAIQSASASSVGGIIRAAAGQTADLLQLQDSSGTVISTLDKSGHLGLGIATPTAKLDINGSAKVIGSELVTNGSFTGSAAGWTLGDCASYGSNQVTVLYDGVCSSPDVSTTIAAQAGHTYQVSFDLTTNGDQMYYYFANNSASGIDWGPFGDGHHTATFTTNYTGTDTIIFESWNWNNNAGWSIDNVSIKEVDAPSALKVTGYDGSTWLSLGNDLMGNTALGAQTLQSNTVGYNNSVTGYQALQSNTTGSDNTANGYQALQLNTTGGYNVAIGSRSLQSNTSGTQNVATGASALQGNTIGFANTATGYYALAFNNGGFANTAAGSLALEFNNGNYNTASGTSALTSNSTGSYNSAFGSDALFNNTTGTGNSVMGYSALQANTTGQYNTVQGFAALDQLTNGDNNTVIGHLAGYNNLTGSGNVFLGNQAGFNELGSNKLYIANNGTTTPLIGGDFSTSVVTFNGSIVGIAPASSVAATFTGAANQDIADFKNSGNTIVASFDKNGNLTTGSITVSAAGAISLIGGNTASRPSSPSAGTVYYDTSTNTLLTYNGTKWMSDKSTATKIVAMGTATGCSGTSPVASADPDGADFVAASCTSAQTAINAAISALPAGGGTVYLKEGTYILDGSITMASHVRLVGAGPSTVLKPKDGLSANFYLINATSVTDIQIDQLGLDGNFSGNASDTFEIAGIYLNIIGTASTPGAVISNITAQNFSKNGWNAIDTISDNNTRITNSTFINGTLYMQGGHNTVLSNNSFYGSAVVSDVKLYNSDSATVTGNTFTGTASALDIQAANGATTTVGGNNFNGVNRGVYISYSTSLNITGNNFDNTTTPIELDAPLPTLPNSQVVISSNKIEGTANASEIGIWIIYATNVSVVGNHIHTLNNYGINISSASAANTYLADNVLQRDTSPSSVIQDLGTGTVYANQQDGSGNLIVKSQGGGMAVGASSANATLNLQGGLNVQTLPAPAAPTVTPVGTTGATTWGYKITALDGVGETVGSTETQITNGNATLTSSNYNKITWAPVGGAYQYKVYRTTAGGTPITPGVIATVNGNVTSFNDQGGAGNLALPFGANTTGSAAIAGSLTVANGGVTISTQMIRMTGQANFYGPSNNYTIIGSGVSGRINVIDNAAFPGTTLRTDASGQIVAAIKEASGQTADLLDLQNSSGNPMTKFNANGDLIIGGTNAAASSNAFQVQDTSGTAFLTVNSSTLTLTVKNVVITASLTVNGHIISGNSSGATTYTVGAAAACGVGYGTSTSGNDTAGTITITVGSTCAGNGALVTVNFANSYGSNPHVTLTPADTNAATLQYYVSSATVNSFTISTNTNVTASTNYTYNYQVMQ